MRELSAKNEDSSDAIYARLAVAAPDHAANEFMYMPGGVHNIDCFLNGKTRVSAQVEVNRDSATALEQQRKALQAKSAHRPYFDFNHEDGAASFWPEAFLWKDSPTPGIYARGEWSSAGREAIEGKTFRTFSGVFHVDDQKAKPARIVCNPNARLNMGGVVNAPAFKSNLPFWAKEAAAPETETSETDTTTMKKTVAELQAKLQELETEITGLKTKAGTDTNSAAELRAKQSEADLTRERIEHAKTSEKNATLETELKARNSRLADTTIAAAVKRGAIAPQNKELQAKWKTLIETNPENASLVDEMEGNAVVGQEQITTGQRIQAKEGPARTVKAYSELMSKNAKMRHTMATAELKRQLGDQAAQIYKAEMSGKNFELYAGAIQQTVHEMSAADPTDANVGILSGTLVAQRTLELFKFELPMLKSMATDFSEMPANLNQVIDTRIVVIPPVMAYDPTVNVTTGLPNGWSIVGTPPKTTDVTVKMDELIGIPIRFTLDVLSSTVRRLFDEQAPAAAYALAKYFIEKAYKLMTPANYNAYAVVNGALVPVAYATFAKAQQDFGRNALNDVKAILNKNEVLKTNRMAFLNADYFNQLGKDPTIVTFYAGQREPEIVTDGELPKLSGFKPWEAPDLTNVNATANLVGFAMQRSAIVLATRLPQDLNQVLPGASNGSVVTLSDPDTGLVMQLVQHVNQSSGFAEWRIQAILGAAVGDKRGGICITSQ